ncbi:hypothetical protein R1sor_022411 [Riccia sorocarpa]|uniref:DUF3456 domain-containing protein n=1 Tax=Riccia sorocarpa TaxID=122646 RepID=A0ABD3GJR8_9MARC
MERFLRVFVLSMLWMVLQTDNLAPALAIRNKCSACQVIAEELEEGLANERPRNHIDLRHRLDSKGQREGKVIDYKVSELRVIELLDGLCAKFKDYTYNKREGGVWMKTFEGNLAGYDRQAAEGYSKELISYCGRLLETYEDELASKIRKGEVKVGEVENALCWELSKQCKGSKKREAKKDDEEEEDDDETVSTESSVESQGSSDGEL